MKTLFSVCVLLLHLNAHANVLGDMQTFNSNTDGLDFITVHSARPLKKDYFGINTHLTYAKNHLLVYRDPLSDQSQVNYKDEMSDLDFSLSYGLTQSLQIFFVSNVLLMQNSQRVEGLKVDITRGMNVNRPGVKWTFSEEHEMAVLASVDFLSVKNNPYTGVDARPIFNLEFAKNFTMSSGTVHGFNIGYRNRRPTAMPTDARMFPLHDQITASYGLSSIWSESARWVFEVIGSYPLNKDPYKSAVDASSLDLLLAMNHNISERFYMNWGGTVEPLIKTLAPQFRIFLGLTYYFDFGSDGSESAKMVKAPAKPEEPLRAEPSALEASQLKISPETIEMYEGAERVFKASNGKRPYTYTIVGGGGEIDESTGAFRAPGTASTVTIEARDATGATAQAVVYVKAPPKADKTIRLKNLQFITATDRLIPSSQKEVERLIGVLQQHNIRRILVEGHTDNRGANAYNQKLSQKRAAKVKSILVRRLGLQNDQVEAIGFGEERPVATNETAKGRLQNRRVDLKVYFKK